MTRLSMAGTVILASLILVPTATAQSLSERISHVRQQQTIKANASKGQMLGTLLYTDLTIQFNETPARDALNYLQSVLGINIIGRYSDDRSGVGIDPDTPITLDIQNQPALTVLELILEQCQDLDDTEWQLRNGFLEVGTKERLSNRGAQEIRYYPIRDLLFEPPMFDNAPDLNISTAMNQGNRGGGGGRGGGGRGGGGGGGGGFGGGGGGGGRGGGGGGGRGGGGGGSIFGDPDDAPDRLSEADKAQEIVDLIVDSVEPDAWDVNGGDYATIRYYQGVLIIRAPDYIHRQIGGYPTPIRPRGVVRSISSAPRYISFTGGVSNVELSDIRTARAVGGATGGSSGVGQPDAP